MRFHSADEPVYIISVASRLLGTSPHVLRMLEREGLLMPARTDKNIRLYSENDLVRLQFICRLMQQDGVNLAGVRAILRMETKDGSVTVTVSSSREGFAEERGAQDRQQGRDKSSAGRNTRSSRDGYF